MRLLTGMAVALALLSTAAGQEKGEGPHAFEADMPKSADAGRVAKSDATAIIRVACDPQEGLAVGGLVDNLLESSELKKRAAVRLNKDAPPDDWTMTVYPLDFGRQTPAYIGQVDPGAAANPPSVLPAGIYMTQVEIASYDEKLEASKLMDAVRDELEVTLADIADSNKRVDRLTQASAELGQRLVRERGEVEQLSKTLGMSSPDEDRAEEQASRFAEERSAMSVQREGLQARCKALQERIAAVGEETKKNVDNDPVVEQLYRVVQIREKMRNNNRAEIHRGKLPESRLMEDEEKVAEAKAELEKYRRLVAQSSGGERLAELQRRLDDAQIEVQEIISKLQALPSPSRGTVDLSYRRFHIKVTEEECRKALEQLNHLQLASKLHSRRVILIPID